MTSARGYAAYKAGEALKPFEFSRRELGPRDVFIEISHCGICHSDIHQVRAEWGEGIFPMVPGHEMIGRVLKVGAQAPKFKVGDLVGVGCFVDSCRSCSACKEGLEQLCEVHTSFSYNGTEQDKTTPTYGGYSNCIVVDESYVLRVPPHLNPAGAAPLLCAGITVFSPFKQWHLQPGQRLAVVGLGGLGHMGVKIATAMGAEVTVVSTSKSKEADARRLGAQDFVVSSDESRMSKLAGSYDMILDTVSASHAFDPLLHLLRRDGVLVLVGVPPTPTPISAMPLISRRRRIAGSLIGGIRETQEMLDFCGRRNITADVEVIPMTKIAEAYDRTVKGDVRYRFVLDLKTL